MDIKPIAEALAMEVLFGHLDSRTYLETAEGIVKYTQEHCEHRWAVWIGSESRTVTAQEIFCGKCGIPGKVELVGTPGWKREVVGPITTQASKEKDGG